jgi:hypothetical protein
MMSIAHALERDIISPFEGRLIHYKRDLNLPWPDVAVKVFADTGVFMKNSGTGRTYPYYRALWKLVEAEQGEEGQNGEEGEEGGEEEDKGGSGKKGNERKRKRRDDDDEEYKPPRKGKARAV